MKLDLRLATEKVIDRLDLIAGIHRVIGSKATIELAGFSDGGTFYHEVEADGEYIEKAIEVDHLHGTLEVRRSDTANNIVNDLGGLKGIIEVVLWNEDKEFYWSI